MAIKKKSEAMRRLEAIAGPLTFGSGLKAIREADEVTQDVFAERLGISKQHLCNVEKGRKSVSVERAAAWAKLLGYSEKQFARLALQDEINRAGLSYSVELAEAS